MTLTVSGGRDNVLSDEGRKILTDIIFTERVDLVFVGDCPTGVDKSIRELCLALPVDFRVFVAYWSIINIEGAVIKRSADGSHSYNAAAGPMRNKRMLETMGKDGYFVAFPGNRGTSDALKCATRVGCKIVNYINRMDLVKL